MAQPAQQCRLLVAHLVGQGGGGAQASGAAGYYYSTSYTARHLELVGSDSVLLERDLAPVERRLVDGPVGVGDQAALLVVLKRAPVVEERDQVERQPVGLGLQVQVAAAVVRREARRCRGELYARGLL